MGNPELLRAGSAVGQRGSQVLHDAGEDRPGLGVAVQAGVKEFGRLDIVLANAGISSPAPTLEMSDDTWQDMIDINLTGVWKSLKSSVPHIIAGGRGGSVVITSSLAAVYANENTAHYSAAKAGLVML